jgi:hypothetical protein
MKSFFLSLICLVTLLSLTISSVVAFTVQNNGKNKALTNSDVIEMVKGGLAENTIILLIQQSSVNFDISPMMLIQLKKQGVSQNIMDKMIQTQTSAAPRALSTGSAAAEPELIGVVCYRNENNSFTPLDRVIATNKLVGSKAVAAVQGEKATTRLSADQRQEFFVRTDSGTDPSRLMLFRFFKSDGIRGINVMQADQAVIACSVTKVGERTYKLMPAQPLPAGEYGFSSFGSNDGFCFGIDGNGSALAEPEVDLENNPVPGLPRNLGLYCKDSNGWIGIEPNTTEPQKSKGGLFKSMVPGRLSGLESVEVFSGAVASVQFSQSKPTLYLRFSSILSGDSETSQALGTEQTILIGGARFEIKDIQLIKLDEKNEQRELHIDFSSGKPENKKNAVEIRVAKISSDILAITPKPELKPGQYVLVLGNPVIRTIAKKYDFGITAK